MLSTAFCCGRRFGNRNELYMWKGTPLANTPANGSQQISAQPKDCSACRVSYGFAINLDMTSLDLKWEDGDFV